MSIGLWVIIGVILLAVGNLMAAKPKIHETRLEKLRSLARQHQLHPKLIPTPAWLKNNAPMIACYTKVDDTWRLPALRFVLQADGAQMLDGTHHATASHLDGLGAYICTISIKANSVSVFWHDEAYTRQFAPHDKEAINTITHHLDCLLQYLDNIAQHHQPTNNKTLP